MFIFCMCKYKSEITLADTFYTCCVSQVEIVPFSVSEHYQETLIVWRANGFHFRPKHVCERSLGLTPPSSAPYQPVYRRQLQTCDLLAFGCSGNIVACSLHLR